ncbi:MAG: hypothetical protein ACRD1R_12730 [Acidobacteriota bacterium]
MKDCFVRTVLSAVILVVGFALCGQWAQAHHPAPRVAASSAAPAQSPASVAGISGEGGMRFRVLYRADHLPQEAVQVLVSAHGGFAVDRRDGKGETYFSLPGAGIIRISSDLKQTRLLDTPEDMKPVNLHNTTVWYGAQGTPYLTFPANNEGRIFTTTLDGSLVHVMNAPTGEDNFDPPAIKTYFQEQGKFAPTDVEQLGGLFYVTTGYSQLDFVLTASILGLSPFKAVWNSLGFGGKGEGAGQFGTGHGITVPPGMKRIDVADRPNSEIDRFTPEGRYLSTLKLPAGSFPCDIDYLEGYAIVGCLHGPDRSKGAPIYILQGDEVVSTIMPKEDLGLETFQHIHNAVLHKVGGRFYIIAQAWNPGDFAILEQVVE